MTCVSNIIQSTSDLSDLKKLAVCNQITAAIQSAANEMRGIEKPQPKSIVMNVMWLEPVDYSWFETAKNNGVDIQISITANSISIIVSK